jgi:hypothetical protein
LIGHDGRFHVTKPPFVQPAIDKESVIQSLLRSLKQGYGNAIKFYNNVSMIAGGDDNVIPFLTGIAQSWNDTRNNDILYMFNGFDPDNIKNLLFWWYKERNLRRLYLFGLTKKEIYDCKMTCDEIFLKCMDNPYTIPAIPLEKCDSITDMMNIVPNTDVRFRGSIIRYLWKNLNEFKWTGTPTKFLGRNFPGVREHITELREQYGLVTELETAYLKYPYKVETTIAEFIYRMTVSDPIKYDTPINETIILEDGTSFIRTPAQFTREMSADQMKAVQGALDHKISIITGPAGTGKTCCLGQVIHNLELRGVSYAVCSFTGKAVARIREVTKKKNPATIHRLISNTKKGKMDKHSSQFDKDIPRGDYDIIIVDEASMVTIELMYEFLQAYPNIKQLILVGDVNQLSPIGWGSMFYQMIKSETIPTYRLVTNYRVYTASGERDGIILNANAIINHDPLYPFEYSPTTNFSVIEGPMERVFDILRGCFSANIKIEQLVVLTPYNKSLEVLNKGFQEIFNDGKHSVTDARGAKWMIGDRVMLTENDQEIGVFNGESGIVRDIAPNAILVDFGQSGCHEFLLEPTKEVKQPYKREYVIDDNDDNNFDDERTVKRLSHSFAISIDKSQGSEWDFVILFIPEFNTGSFINKNRIYTAITRAKRCFWAVVSDSESFDVASTKLPPYRCDNLARRLTMKLPNLKPYKSNNNIKALEMSGDLPTYPEDDIPEDEMDTGYDCDDY